MRLFFITACLNLIAYNGDSASAANATSPSVDDILNLYVKAVGGEGAIDKIQTREVRGTLHHRKVVYYWQKPNKVLQLIGRAKTAYDGGSGWELSAKKKVTRLPKGSETALEMNANPLRYIHLKDLYHDLSAGPVETIDGQAMDVLVSPNSLASTKFYFDAHTHLLTRIAELGVTSAYYKHVTNFDDYKDLNGLQFPFRVIHQTEEPGIGTDDFHISKVKQNVELEAQIFTKPNVAPVVLGGKR